MALFSYYHPGQLSSAHWMEEKWSSAASGSVRCGQGTSSVTNISHSFYPKCPVHPLKLSQPPHTSPSFPNNPFIFLLRTGKPAWNHIISFPLATQAYCRITQDFFWVPFLPALFDVILLPPLKLHVFCIWTSVRAFSDVKLWRQLASLQWLPLSPHCALCWAPGAVPESTARRRCDSLTHCDVIMNARVNPVLYVRCVLSCQLRDISNKRQARDMEQTTFGCSMNAIISALVAEQFTTHY